MTRPSAALLTRKLAARCRRRRRRSLPPSIGHRRGREEPSLCASIGLEAVPARSAARRWSISMLSRTKSYATQMRNASSLLKQLLSP